MMTEEQKADLRARWAEFEKDSSPYGPRHFDRDGKPISMADMVILSEDRGYKIVGRAELHGGVLVSTVWLGLDHSFREGPPIIFETMDFPFHLTDRRYSTLEEARRGHEEAVQLVTRVWGAKRLPRKQKKALKKRPETDDPERVMGRRWRRMARSASRGAAEIKGKTQARAEACRALRGWPPSRPDVLPAVRLTNR
jgi:hypothetical protein